MITRIFRVKIHPELKSEFEKEYQEISIPLVKSQKGLVSVSTGKPINAGQEEYVMISTWENKEALINFVGENWDKPFIPSGMEKFVIECWVHHYEV